MPALRFKIRIIFILAFVITAAAFAASVRAQIFFGAVRGVVHDPQHRPIPGANVQIKAKASDWVEHQSTNENGEFEFPAVPVGEYSVTVEAANFQIVEQPLMVESGTSPVLHFELPLAGRTEQTTVTASPVEANTSTATPTTLLSRQEINATPGADRTNSLAMITDNVPGAYVTHDQLHIRGGHQVSWLVDGVPVPNTNISSNVGPQFDPKDVDYLEAQRGSYSADFGDRTYGVFNVVPRTGFERDNECDVVASFGNFYQTNDDFSCGGHTERLAYYGSVNGNRSNLGLQPPTPQVIHDTENGLGGFGSLIFNLDAKDQLRLVISSRRDFYQIPVSNGAINEIESTPGAIYLTPCSPSVTAPSPCPAGVTQSDTENEADTFVNFSWVRTIRSNILLTVSPLFHYNSANYVGNGADFPTGTTDEHASNYAGGQVTYAQTIARNTISAGLYGFWQRDKQFFSVLFNDSSAPNFADREIATGSLAEAWIEDKFQPAAWLTLSGGLRQSHFSSSVAENAASPRAGVSVQLPKIHWVLHGFYGDFYQPPPLLTFTGPALVNAAGGQGFAFGSLHGERDEEYQFGITTPIKGWSLDTDTFRTRANNYFDHNVLGESNVFIPVTLSEALIRGWELTLKSPKLWNRAQVHLAYSNQIAEFRGNITGGLIPTGNTPIPNYVPLDHDQRNTLNVGGEVTLPRSLFASSNVYYGSGFTNGDGPGLLDTTVCCSVLDYLPGHTTVDVSIGKNFGAHFSASVNALNVGNRRVMLDNSLTFGGFHFTDPREVYVEIRYRFHY